MKTVKVRGNRNYRFNKEKKDEGNRRMTTRD